MDRIDVFAVARTGARWEGHVPLASMHRLAADLLLEHGGAEPLRYRCHGFTDAQGRPALRIELSASLPVRCDRCAQALRLPLAAARDFYFVATSAQLAAIPIDDTPEEALLGSAQFDLAGLIEDEAILQLPLSPRHADCTWAAPLQGTFASQDAPLPAHLGGEPQAKPNPFAALREQMHQNSAIGPREPGSAAQVPDAQGPDEQGANALPASSEANGHEPGGVAAQGSGRARRRTT